MPNQEFGGDWTQQKLQILDKYLTAYCQIFRQNERAKFLRPFMSTLLQELA
jgi:hypothetical protein